jgi:hypothetical protein
VRRLVKIVGRLHGKRSARSQPFDQRREHRLMVGNPLQHGVGQNNGQRPAGPPFAKVGDLKVDVGYALARRLDHFRRAVDASDVRIRIALTQNLGRIARTAAKVDGARDLCERNSLNEVPNRKGPLLFELDVLSN